MTKSKRRRKRVKRKSFSLEPSGIELLVRRALRRRGVRWRSGVCVRGFYPDLYLPDYNALVEVNGCFWHACKKCYPRKHANRQRSRDRQKIAVYYKEGFTPVTIWEHEIRRDVDTAVARALNRL